MFGIITIAQGEKRYIEMAKMLSLSLQQTNPEIAMAVISDAPENEFKGYFDTYIQYNPDYGKGLSQKLYLDKYSPFDETLFIDSDCLVFKPIDAMVELCKTQLFSVFGGQINSGEWYMDVAATCKKYNVKAIPLFNGGTYFFKKSEKVTAIYNKARELIQNYKELGFKDFRGSINEEPLVAVAMALNDVKGIDDSGTGMRTPIGLIGPMNIDILSNKCVFNKEGVIVEPAILHFSGSFSTLFHYKREVLKLKATRLFPFVNKKLISFSINLACNLPYGIFVFFKRITKYILRKEKFDFKNSLPAFSNH